ncbi:MAG: hypothetical protein ABSG41_00160 [Bryobacteraceae bacterium]
MWYLLKNPRLSKTARIFVGEAARAGDGIMLSPISLAEIVYLVEKNRLPIAAYNDLKAEWKFLTCLIASWRPQPCTSACLSSVATVAYVLQEFRRCGDTQVK